MKRHVLYFAVISLIIGHAAWADDKNVEQMRQLYTKLRNIVNVTDNEVRPGGTYLVLLNPGIILDPQLNPDTDDQDRLILNSVIDRTMEPGWIYRPYSVLASDVYARVLDYHEAPEFKLPPATQSELDSLNKEFVQEVNGKKTRTARYSQYQEYLGAYATAIDNTRTWMNANPGKLPLASLVTSEQNARDDFYTLGDGQKVSRDLQRKHEIESYDPNYWWAELRDNYQAYTDGSTPSKRFPRNLYYPKYGTWLDPNRAWTKLSLSQSDLEKTVSDGSTSTGGGLGASWGFFRVSASGGGSTNWKNVDATYSGMDLGFEVTRVNIYRPWMDTTVFYSDAWCWNSGAPDVTPVSNGGDPTKGQQLNGRMPFLPTGILLARNVAVSAHWSRDISNDFNSAVSGSGGISFGPFSFGGSHSEFHHTAYTHGTASSTGFSFKDPQILGFFVEVLPRSPDPNPNLKFASCKPAPTGPLVATGPHATVLELAHSPVLAQLRQDTDLKKELDVDELFVQQSRLRLLNLQPESPDAK